jgi:hypothetical protein
MLDVLNGIGIIKNALHALLDGYLIINKFVSLLLIIVNNMTQQAFVNHVIKDMILSAEYVIFQ